MGFDVTSIPAWQMAFLYGAPDSASTGTGSQPAAANQPTAADGNAAAQPAAANQPTAASSYNADLARILRNVSRETWKAVGVTDLTALKGLTSVKADRKLLNQLGETAAKAEKKLSKLATLDARTVGQALAKVQDAEEGKGVASKEEKDIAGLLTDATDLLADISKGLFDLVNRSKDGPFRDGCENLAMLCDSRASELSTLGIQLSVIVRDPKMSAAYDPLQTNNFVELTKGMGGVMHDNYETVAAMETGGDSVGKLFQNLQDMTQVKERSNDDSSKVDELKCRMTTLGPGIVADGKRGALSAAAVDRLRVTFSKMPQRTEIAAEYARRFIDSQRIPFAEVLQGVDATTCPILSLMRNEQEAWFAALEAVANAKPNTRAFTETSAAAQRQAVAYATFVSGLFADKEDAPGRLNISAFRAELESIVKRGADTPAGKTARGFLDLLESAEREVVRYKAAGKKTMTVHRALGRAIYGCTKAFDSSWTEDYFNTQLERVQDLAMNGENYRLDDVAKSILGRTDLSKPLLGRLYGVAGKYVDSSLSDDKIVKSEEGKAGAASKTEVISYYTGDPNQPTKEVVFKPDFAAAANDKQLFLAQDGMYGEREGPRPLQLNIATHELGKLLGCGDITVKTTPLFHNGQLGLGMEKAPGKEAASFAKEDMRDVKRLVISENPSDRVKYRKITNDLMCKTSGMQWFDIMCGQGDRHGGNFMVGVNGAEVSLKTIDNDMSFGANRVGLTKVILSADQIESLVKRTAERIRKHRPDIKTAEAKTALKNEVGRWVRGQIKDGVFEYKSENCPIEFKWALQQTLGYTALMAPKVMSRKMADRFLELAKDGGKSFNDFCVKLMNERLLLDDWREKDDEYVKDSIAAMKSRFNEIVALINDGSLVLVDEPTEKNPTPWLDDKVVAAVRQKRQEYIWGGTAYSSLSVQDKKSYEDENNKARRVDLHPMVYGFEHLILPAMLKASLGQS